MERFVSGKRAVVEKAPLPSEEEGQSFSRWMYKQQPGVTNRWAAKRA
jgi:hypothetical protein